VSSDAAAGGPADVAVEPVVDPAASAAEQMAAATQALRARLPLLHGEDPPAPEPYPA
jgi:hypothetical protein